MDQPLNSAEQGNTMFFLSCFLGLLGFAPTDFETGMRIIVLFGSICTAIFAVRYYIAAKKEKEQQILINKDKLDEIERIKSNGHIQKEKQENDEV